MNAPDTKRSVAGVVGFGAAACAACCAGPVLGFLAAAGLLTAGSIAMFGVGGLLVAVPVALWYRRRRARQQVCSIPATVPVELVARPSTTTADRTTNDDGAPVVTR